MPDRQQLIEEVIDLGLKVVLGRLEVNLLEGTPELLQGVALLIQSQKWKAAELATPAIIQEILKDQQRGRS